MEYYYQQIDTKIYLKSFMDQSIKEEVILPQGLNKSQVERINDLLMHAYTLGVVAGEKKIKYHIKEALGLNG